MNLEQAFQTFLDETGELLVDMERVLLALEAAPADAERLNALFRCVHTIKGSAGMFGLDHVVAFTHVVENVLDRLRAGELTLAPRLAALLLECRDHIARLVELAPGKTPADELLQSGRALLDRLDPARDPACATTPNPAEPVIETTAGGASPAGHWHISVRFQPEVLQHGMDPIGFIRYLRSLGEITRVATLSEALPPAEAMDPDACYLGFEIDLRSDADRATIEGVFEFVRELCTLSIQAADEVAAIGEAPVPAGALQPEPAAAALTTQAPGRDQKTRASQYIRIQADKLDRLINLVGELVIASASTTLTAAASGDAATMESAAGITRLVEEIRDSSLQLRMVPIGETFQRFQRVVRDVSHELGKEIELVISGADTELDKTVVEKIGDPLTHLVRNCVDHGVEPAAKRAARGKPARGTVRLNAYHESGSIVIEVGDDGGGLDRERIFAKAVERGLAKPEDELSDSAVFNLIFEPGFSTAAAVTNLSGRGVGMDVVRRSIEALRGTVELHSQAGEGTTFRIRLPLTLAIIDGFLARVGEATYVVPLEMVVECLEFPSGAEQGSGERNFINLRGQVLPFIRLRQQFDVQGGAARRQNIIVVQYAGQKAGLVVDELLGEHQTVIKPLGGLFAHVQGVSGSTILGTGRVALILDVPALLSQVGRHEERALGARNSLRQIPDRAPALN